MFHQDKYGLGDDIAALANNATNPKHRVVKHLREKWVQRNMGGSDHLSIEDRLRSYAENHQQLTMKIDINEAEICVVIVSDFMKRVHQLREAGEVAFVDATSSCDAQNIAVVPILCASPSGALPLAFMFLSNQTEEMFTKGKE